MKGQSLIEVLVALGVGALIVASITVAVLAALNNAQYSKNQNLATQYAQQGMEIMRNLRDNSWSVFNAYGSPTGIKYCLDKNRTNLTNPPAGGSTSCSVVSCLPANVDTFVREVCIENPSSSCNNNGIKAAVAVYWSDSKCTDAGNPYCHKAQTVSCFSDANVIESP